MNLPMPELQAIADAHAFPLLFATVSGAHLYGFPSPDSDFDLRGVHVLPARELLGLDTGPETIEVSRMERGLDLDLVTHDAGKFFGLMLTRNGYVLEQLFSPLVVRAMPQHEELKRLAQGCITRHHAHHYLGFAAGQWKLLHKDAQPRVKPLLYVYRVLLTGIHLMRTGRIEANVLHLNEEFRLPYIADLAARKLSGPEKGLLSAPDLTFHEKEYARLTALLEAEQSMSKLPDAPTARERLHRLLLELRLPILG
jgi:predicted nucleotidyltransferase